MLNQGQCCCLTDTIDGNILTYQDSSTVEDQANLFSDQHLVPSNVTLDTKNDDLVIQFLDVYRQRLYANAEAIRELHHRRRMAKPRTGIISPVRSIPDNNAFQLFTDLGSSGIDLGAFKYHELHSVSMDTLHPTDAFHPVETPVVNSPVTVPIQHQTWVSPCGAQPSMLHRGREIPPFQWAMGHYERRSAPFSQPDAIYYQELATPEYGCVSEISLDDSSLSLQPVTSPSTFVGTVGAGKGDTQSSVAPSSGGEVSEPTIVSYTSGGVKHHRCECGFESASKGCMDRHRECLRHSERKYWCACRKRFTRVDSLKRHRKRCHNQQP